MAGFFETIGNYWSAPKCGFFNKETDISYVNLRLKKDYANYGDFIKQELVSDFERDNVEDSLITITATILRNFPGNSDTNSILSSGNMIRVPTTLLKEEHKRTPNYKDKIKNLTLEEVEKFTPPDRKSYIYSTKTAQLGEQGQNIKQLVDEFVKDSNANGFIDFFDRVQKTIPTIIRTYPRNPHCKSEELYEREDLYLPASLLPIVNEEDRRIIEGFPVVELPEKINNTNTPDSKEEKPQAFIPSPPTYLKEFVAALGSLPKKISLRNDKNSSSLTIKDFVEKVFPSLKINLSENSKKDPDFLKFVEDSLKQANPEIEFITNKEGESAFKLKEGKNPINLEALSAKAQNEAASCIKVNEDSQNLNNLAEYIKEEMNELYKLIGETKLIKTKEADKEAYNKDILKISQTLQDANPQIKNEEGVLFWTKTKCAENIEEVKGKKLEKGQELLIPPIYASLIAKKNKIKELLKEIKNYEEEIQKLEGDLKTQEDLLKSNVENLASVQAELDKVKAEQNQTNQKEQQLLNEEQQLNQWHQEQRARFIIENDQLKNDIKYTQQTIAYFQSEKQQLTGQLQQLGAEINQSESSYPSSSPSRPERPISPQENPTEEEQPPVRAWADSTPVPEITIGQATTKGEINYINSTSIDPSGIPILRFSELETHINNIDSYINNGIQRCPYLYYPDDLIPPEEPLDGAAYSEIIKKLRDNGLEINDPKVIKAFIEMGPWLINYELDNNYPVFDRKVALMALLNRLNALNNKFNAEDWQTLCYLVLNNIDPEITSWNKGDISDWNGLVKKGVFAKGKYLRAAFNSLKESKSAELSSSSILLQNYRENYMKYAQAIIEILNGDFNATTQDGTVYNLKKTFSFNHGLGNIYQNENFSGTGNYGRNKNDITFAFK